MLAFAMVLTLIAPPVWAQGANAQVVGRHKAIATQVSGTVEVKPVGQERWVAVAVNRELKTGDRVRTGPNSRCKIKVGDVGEVDLLPSTEVSVGNLQQVRTTARAFFMFQRTITRDDVAVDQRSGDVRCNFRRSEGRVGNYNVYTPVATAGVRGTKFELDLEGGRPWYEQMEGNKGDGDEQSLNTTVLEGEVELLGPNWSRSVSGGQQLQVQQGQTPGQPSSADPDKLNELQGAFSGSQDLKAPTFSGAQSIERLSPTSTKVSWNAASDDSSAVSAIVYDVYVATTSGGQDFSTPTATTEPGALSYTLDGLTANVDPFVVVRARDEAANRDENRKEVTTSSAQTMDDEEPDFDGAEKATRETPTSIKVEWYAATDNRSDAAKIVYDLYLSEYPSGQDFDDPDATAPAGATSFTLTNLVENKDYYIVVRARDEAGNSDENEEEVTTFVYVAGTVSDTTQRLIDITDELFKAYANSNATGFMDLVDPSFAGTNNANNALTYSTLLESLNGDFTALENFTVEYTFTSATNYGGGKYGVSLGWNGTYKFVGVAEEKKLTGQSMKMTWEYDAEEDEFFLTGWEGASPFGLTKPEAAETIEEFLDDFDEIFPDDDDEIDTTLPAPVISNVLGLITTFNITGDYQDFGPYSVTIQGTGFQSGCQVFERDDDDVLWEDIETPDVDMEASVYFISETEVRVDITKQIMQYFPDDDPMQTIYFKVVNPDGQESGEFSFTVTGSPGNLSLTSVATDRPVTTATGENYLFTVTGYNMVTPLSNIEIVDNDYLVVPDFTVNMGMHNVGATDEGQPLTLVFPATVSGTNLSAGTYYVRVTDARSQSQTASFSVTAAASNNWTTNQTLASDYTVTSGTTLTISAGVTVSTTADARIIVDGTLNASGATFDGVGLTFQPGSIGVIGNSTIQNVNSGGGVFGGGAASGPTTGITVASGDVGLTSVTITNSGTGVEVVGGTLTTSGGSITSNTNAGMVVSSGNATISGTMIQTNGMGVSVEGAANVSITNSTISQNTSTGVSASGGATVGIASASQIMANGTEGVLVSDANSVSIASSTISTNTTGGIHLDGSASGATLSMSNTQVDGSPRALWAEAGTIQLTGNNTLTGTSTAGVELGGGATLTTTGSNVIEGNGNSTAALSCPSGSSGLVTLGDNTVIRNAMVGLLLRGGGTINGAGSGLRIENCGTGIDIASSSSPLNLVSGVKIQNNSGYGVLAADCGGVILDGIDVLNNGSHGVARPSASTYAGAVSLNNVLLQANNGESVNDMNTSPPTSNSTQYIYLVYPPNTVSNPR